MTESEVQTKTEAPALPTDKEKDEKPRFPQGGRRRNKSGEAKREFANFTNKLKKQHGEEALTIKVIDCPEGIEFSLKVNKKKERKELTEQQKAKKAEKQEKRQDNEKKMEKRDEGVENLADGRENLVKDLGE